MSISCALLVFCSWSRCVCVCVSVCVHACVRVLVYVCVREREQLRANDVNLLFCVQLRANAHEYVQLRANNVNLLCSFGVLRMEQVCVYVYVYEYVCVCVFVYVCACVCVQMCALKSQLKK